MALQCGRAYPHLSLLVQTSPPAVLLLASMLVPLLPGLGSLTHIGAATAAKLASVVSDSVWPHRWQPTRLRRSWDSPGKNTGVGCHFLLQCMKVKSESEVAQSCPTLLDPMDCSLPGSSIHGIFQARVLEWGAIAFSVTWVEIFILRVVYDSLKQCSFLLGQVPLTSPVLQDRDFSWLWFYFSQWPHLVIPILLESKVNFLSVHFLFFSSFGFLQWTWV